jgi:hypothetical protein
MSPPPGFVPPSDLVRVVNSVGVARIGSPVIVPPAWKRPRVTCRVGWSDGRITSLAGLVHAWSPDAVLVAVWDPDDLLQHLPWLSVRDVHRAA